MSFSKKIDNYSKYSKIILRISISILFLWFGFSQIINPSEWVGFLPEFVSNLPLTPENFVLMNGIMEVFLASLLIVGYYTRLSSFLLGIHLFGIALSMGYSAIAVRDLILTISTLIVFLNGEDDYCLDKYLIKN